MDGAYTGVPAGVEGRSTISSCESLMFSLGRRVQTLVPPMRSAAGQLRRIRTEGGQPRRRPRPAFVAKKTEEKSEWWIVDGEMHEIGDHIPLRERFVIPRENLPNRRRKQLREQFMRRTRLVLKEAEHEPWCRRYMELYQELRENWERLYWDEGYSKKIARDHANYDSAEDDDRDFSPYRSRQFNPGQNQVQGFGRNKESDTWEKVSQIRDKFEYDREKRMREKAFAPINSSRPSNLHKGTSREQPFEAKEYISESE